jgi:predicted  nucleic acid-binding Zn-ribbon protein
MVQLQQKFDALGRANNAHSAEALGERDSAHMRSLQQRLEQLVAVHRQLLRKFASLELETVELKKKTQLRDERIRQLEGSSRGLISNIRQQAERHVAELTHLREQMTVSYLALLGVALVDGVQAWVVPFTAAVAACYIRFVFIIC